MCRLGFNEQLVDLQALMFWECAEVHSQFDHRKQIERFLRWHCMGVGEDAIGATDLVAKRAWLSLKQSLPRVMFLIDNRFDDFTQTIDDLFLFFSERGLIRNLEKIPHRFGAFTVKAADGKTDLANCLDDLVNQLAEDKSGKMQHRRRAHTGANVGRTSGQISKA